MQAVAAGRRRASESACLPSPSSPVCPRTRPVRSRIRRPHGCHPKPHPARRMTSTCAYFLSLCNSSPAVQSESVAPPAVPGHFSVSGPTRKHFDAAAQPGQHDAQYLQGTNARIHKHGRSGPCLEKRDGGWAGTKFSGANAGDPPRGKPQHEAASRLEAASFAPHSGSPNHRFSPTAREAWLLRWSEMWSSRVCMRDRP